MKLPSTAIFREGVKGKQRPFGLQLCASHGRTRCGIFVVDQLMVKTRLIRLSPQWSLCDVRDLFQDEWCTTLNMHKLYTERPAAKFLQLNMIPSPFIPELRSCVKVEVAVLGSPSLIVCTISLDVKQQRTCCIVRAQEPCESRGGRPGLPVPNILYGLWGREATYELAVSQSSGAVWKSRLPSWVPVLISLRFLWP